MIERLINWDFTANLEKFRMEAFFQVIVNADFEICPGYGWNSEEIGMLVTTAVKLTNCYKVIFRDLADFSTTWTGYDAQWLDDCQLSSDATIKFAEVVFNDAFDDYILGGTLNPLSVDRCYPLPGISSEASPTVASTSYQGVDAFAKMFYTNLDSYMGETYGKSLGLAALQ